MTCAAFLSTNKFTVSYVHNVFYGVKQSLLLTRGKPAVDPIGIPGMLPADINNASRVSFFGLAPTVDCRSGSKWFKKGTRGSSNPNNLWPTGRSSTFEPRRTLVRLESLQNIFAIL